LKRCSGACHEKGKQTENPQQHHRVPDFSRQAGEDVKKQP
jgi:hypothetical protein